MSERIIVSTSFFAASSVLFYYLLHFRAKFCSHQSCGQLISELKQKTPSPATKTTSAAEFGHSQCLEEFSRASDCLGHNLKQKLASSRHKHRQEKTCLKVTFSSFFIPHSLAPAQSIHSLVSNLIINSQQLQLSLLLTLYTLSTHSHIPQQTSADVTHLHTQTNHMQSFFIAIWHTVCQLFPALEPVPDFLSTESLCAIMVFWFVCFYPPLIFFLFFHFIAFLPFSHTKPTSMAYE